MVKNKLAKPFLLLLGFVLIVGLACITSTPEPEEPTPAPAEPAAPVEEAASPVPQPTTPPEPVSEQYYTEEFAGDASQWTYFLVDGNKSVPSYVEEDFGIMSVGVEDERLIFDLGSEGQWAYVTYGAFEYENVRLDVVADNRGVNKNSVSLICRYTDTGWYEFNIANNGLYNIYYAQVLDNNKMVYHPIKNGGANKIKSGKEVNEYSIICEEKTLTLYVNGDERISFEENDYALREGKIGVGVSSFDILPVEVEIDTITISQPK